MGVLKTIEQENTNRLLADPYFSNVPVINQQIGDIANEIAIAVGSIGVCVIVMVPNADVKYPNIPGPYFDGIYLKVRVVENVIVNQGASGTGKGALDIAEYVVALIHHFSPQSLSEIMNAANPTITLGNDPNFLNYDVHFFTQGGLSYVINPVAAITHSYDGTNVTLTETTPGAAVFYTTYPTGNSSIFPSPQVGTLYTGPFVLATGNTVQAVAYLAGMLDSVLLNFSV